jgi:hypothetical protein
MRVRTVFQASLVLLASAFAREIPAAIITYEATPLGGTLWQYDYVVTNTDLATIEWFAIFFAVNPVEQPYDPANPPPPPPNIDLTAIAAPSGWSALDIDPDPYLPDFGYADYQIFGGPSGIGLGQTLGGFSVQFDLPSGTPGSQAFDIYDLQAFLGTCNPDTGCGPLTVLQSGFTTPAGPVTVPEPGTWLLLASALLALGFARGTAGRRASSARAAPREPALALASARGVRGACVR